MSETKGECRQQLEAWYANNSSSVPRYSWMVADAIDRLAADVAAIKAKVDAVAPEDVKHFVESEKAFAELFAEQRDAAIRERDQWREEARLAVINRDEARAEVERLKESRDRLIHLCGKQQDEVDRLRKELEQRQTDGNRPEIPDSSPAAPQPAGQGISLGLPGTQPPRNAAPPAGWLTDRERRAVAYFAQVCRDDLVPDEWTDNAGVLRSILARAAPQPAAPAAWWLTEEERAEIMHLLLIQRHNTGWTTERHAELNRLLARAGSPPVVEVPAMVFGSGSYEMQKRYRAALDKAGVKWKEVGRE